MREVRVGVVGYCPPTRFDEDAARAMVMEAFDAIAVQHADARFVCVSGLCHAGVPGIAYEEAARRGWRTIGFTSAKTLESGVPKYPVDETIIVGHDWGEESAAFVAYVHVLVHIGSGSQSMREIAACRCLGKPTYEFELLRL